MGEPIILSDGQLAVLRDLPEVCGVAAPGEVLDGVKAEPAHYLVQFWPLLTHDAPKMTWQLGVPLLFDIDTTAERNAEGDGTDVRGRDHFSKPVRCVTLGGSHLHRYVYSAVSSSSYGNPPEGALCRGAASFSNDPFACTLTLRLWLTQTVEGMYEHGDSTAMVMWWHDYSTQFFARFPRPMALLLPSGTGRKAVEVVALQKNWAELMVAGKRKESLLGEAKNVAVA